MSTVKTEEKKPTTETSQESTETKEQVPGSASSYQMWDPKSPPPPEVDCFGKFYFAGDPACDGDPSKPGDIPCICREECRVSTAARLERIRKAETKSSDGGSGVRKTRVVLTAEELLAKAPSVEGLNVRLSDDKDGVVYEDGKVDAVYFILTGKGKNQCLYVGSRSQYEGSALHDGWWENGSDGKFQPVDEVLEKMETIVRDYVKSKASKK